MQSDNTADTGTDTLISFNERPDTPIFPFPRFYGECLNLPEPNRFYHLWSSCGQYYLVFDERVRRALLSHPSHLTLIAHEVRGWFPSFTDHDDGSFIEIREPLSVWLVTAVQ